MILLGDDFTYADHDESFKYFSFIFQLMERISEVVDVGIGTPSDYFDAVFEKNPPFAVYENDWFPLIDEQSHKEMRNSWTGFYSSKPYLKKLIYDLSNQVRTAEILSSLVLKSEFFAYELCLSTHHDSVTGTCTYPVYLDYISRLSEDSKKSFIIISQSFIKLLNPALSNELASPIKVLIIFNPVNWPVRQTINIEVGLKYLKIQDSNGDNLKIETIELNGKILAFFEYSLQGLEIKTLFIHTLTSKSESSSKFLKTSNKNRIRNKVMELNMKKGMISSIKQDSQEYVVNSRFVRYSTGNGGEYLFGPTV